MKRALTERRVGFRREVIAVRFVRIKVWRGRIAQRERTHFRRDDGVGIEPARGIERVFNANERAKEARKALGQKGRANTAVPARDA